MLERNKLSKQKDVPKEEKIEKGRKLKQDIAEAETELKELETLLYQEAQLIPNLTHPDVPVGEEVNARVVKLGGEKRDFGFQPKDHCELGKATVLIHNMRCYDLVLYVALQEKRCSFGIGSLRPPSLGHDSRH